MAKDYGDQRTSRRYNVRDFELYWTPGGLLSFLSAAKQAKNKLPVVNFSIGGAQFLSAKDMTQGERVRIHLVNPVLAEPMVLEAEICWSRQIPRRSAYRVGVRFTSDSSRNRDKLQELEAKLSGMTIRLRCAGCGTPFSVKKSFEGEAGRCPRCKAVVEVREEEILPELPEEKRAAEDKPGPAAARPVSGAGISKTIDGFIRTSVPSRLHLQLIQHFAKRPAGQVAGVSELAMLVTTPEPRVHAALREMVSQGILKELGAKTFNYDPSPEAKRKIAELATLLNNPQRRSEVLAVVLDAEKNKK
ncbi:MAG TPA: PilZ domain-containing protein [Planctomycetota bacterium]|nr:PilZ domain-containing protein [Planctomycetota bacterium]